MIRDRVINPETVGHRWTYLLVMLWVVCPSKGAIVGSLKPRIGGQTGEAMAQYVGRDVRRQITQLDDLNHIF